jgi:phosphoribosyl 1,2-cyclic phosphodiesterase
VLYASEGNGIADPARESRMGLRFTVLASGSSGNATLVEAGDFGVLIDVGLGPRQLSSRLATAGLSWSDVDAVLLTHTHTDHWKETTLAHLHRRSIPLFCHSDHHGTLSGSSDWFATLLSASLVRSFVSGETFELAPSLNCRPVPVRHDCVTFGFRFEAEPDLFGRPASLAYAADLGSWDDELASALADVDLLAIEFNHDVELEYASGRMPRLIARVLGDEGHLSNAQATELVQAVVARSSPGRLRHLVQLHLSRDCNRPALARAAGTFALAGQIGVRLHTAEQYAAGATVHIGQNQPRSRKAAKPRRRRPVAPASAEPWLPGITE